MSKFRNHGCAVLLLAAPLYSSPGAAQAPKAPAAPAVTLKVGDQAPAFVHGAWLKGKPVQALAKGQTYVLEFWATWCGPCKQAIPHVTELAKKYAGKVTFIGVNVMQEGKDPKAIDASVAAFVKSQGAAMEYRVCRDTRDDGMKKTWLDAAGVQGIPATFIVDGTGRLVWKGHPLSMDPVLEQLAAGTFDPVAAIAEAKTNKEALERISEALKAKEWQKALELASTCKPKSKVDIMSVEWLRFQALLHVDEKAALALYDSSIKDAPDWAFPFVGTVIRTDGLSKDWYLRVIPTLEELVKKEPAAVGMLAEAQFRAGDFANAARNKAKEIEELKGRLPGILKEHPDAGPMVKGALAKMEAELKEYQAAVKP
ncbi:TlpA family protein disulfide reductase [Mesoterricola silvestris]|uniref:Thioredoxin domain-containing protein n=1 Tax=Mesoterricola silvestris TaxID=2927979 RepID=A0AA48GR89_9BACT|nr:TlpA disulfide reductase family protein [Mesoterricola silvestris]BDU74669.1 hypothetical protein METEAL_38430 [Mesoterricola silvestris]